MKKDDISLMQFGVKFMKQAFFAERTIPECNYAWDKRVEQRQDEWDARHEAVISRRAQMDEEKYKSD